MAGEVTEKAGKLVVTLEGSIDLERAPQVRATLLECTAKKMDLVIDLSAVEYIDSSGIANLVEALQATQNAGRALRLVAVSGQVYRVLKLARLDKVFTIHGALEDAIAEAA